MTLVWMFPGQSSRYPGMLDKLCALDDTGAALVERASELLGRDLRQHYRAEGEVAYGCNRDVQIGVFLANQLFANLLERAGVRAELSLGLSLGEYNHLVHIGAVGFDEALGAVEARGRAYDDGPRGAMASVFPIELEQLQEVCRRVADHGVVEVVNLNSPRQQVLSGETAALERALEIIEEDYYAQATVIERQVPMHCSIFEPVSRAFRRHLETMRFSKPRLPYLPNRNGEPVEQPDFVELLSSHVCRPVLWRKSIDWVLGRWPDATLLEVGPKRVLYNLIDKKWHRGVRKLHIDSAEDTAAHLEEVIAALRQA